MGILAASDALTDPTLGRSLHTDVEAAGEYFAGVDAELQRRLPTELTDVLGLMLPRDGRDHRE